VLGLRTYHSFWDWERTACVGTEGPRVFLCQGRGSAKSTACAGIIRLVLGLGTYHLCWD